MRADVAVMLALLVLVLAGSCGRGGGLPAPEPSDLYAYEVAGDWAYVYGPPGSADPGTPVLVPTPIQGQATVAADGSFIVRNLEQFTSYSVQFISQGVARTQVVPRQQYSDFVTKPLFGTGSGPNDMIFAEESLYIANSLDNSVARYELDGALLSQANFAQFASPSYLALGNAALIAVCNGSNEIVSRGIPDFAASPAQSIQLDAAGAAFLGPSQPVLLPGGDVAVPLNNISTFAPTAYGAGVLALGSFDRPLETSQLNLPQGVNAQYASYDAARGLLYVVCAGDIQFDENFVPHAAGNSILEVVDPAERSVLDSINLGLIGAGRIAISPDADYAYLGNALTGNVYKIDLAARVVLRGADNPIVLTAEYTFISDLAFTPDGRWLLATSFNTDELYVIDPATDEVSPAPYVAPFDLALDPQLLAGCVNVEIDPAPRADGGYTAYVLYGVANAVAKVELLH